MFEKILVVEDDNDLRLTLVDQLLANHYEVIQAEDGEQAIAKFSRHKPNLIILDLLLPKLDGFEVLKTLQQQPQFKNTPVIIYTNLAKSEFMQKAKEMSVSDYYVKSQTEVGDLCGRIQKLLIEAPTRGQNKILQSNSLDVSGQFQTMDHASFKDFLKGKQQESGLIIHSKLTGNYGDDLTLLARLQQFLNDTPALGQKRYAIVRASREEHDKHFDDFNSGILWKKNDGD